MTANFQKSWSLVEMLMLVEIVFVLHRVTSSMFCVLLRTQSHTDINHCKRGEQKQNLKEDNPSNTNMSTKKHAHTLC